MAQICTKSFVGWGFAPDATGEAPDHLAGLGVGPPGKGKEGREGKKEEERGGSGGEDKEGEGVPECPNPELASLNHL